MKRTPDEMTLAQLRRLARRWPATEIDKLSREALASYVGAAQRLESAPMAELRALGKKWQIRGSGRMEREQLLPRILLAECWNLMSLPDLRILARSGGVEGTARLKKTELVQRLVQTVAREEVSLRAQPVRGRRVLGAARRARERLAAAHWRRGVGLAVQSAGGLGAALCLVCLVILPLVAGRVAATCRESLASLAEAAGTLRDPLEIAAGSLGEGAATLDAVGTMLLSAEASLESLEPLLDSVGEVVGEDAPAAIEAARGALVSAEAGAAAIDSTLRALSYLGPLTGVTYDPEQSLQDSLAEVGASLEELPDDLRGIQDDLDAAVEDLEPVRSSMEDVAGHLDVLAASLAGLEEYILIQSTALDSLALSADRAAESAPAWVWRMTAACELLLLLTWLEQIAVLLVGRQLRIGGEVTL